jgi:hypothetical protein
MTSTEQRGAVICLIAVWMFVGIAGAANGDPLVFAVLPFGPGWLVKSLLPGDAYVVVLVCAVSWIAAMIVLHVRFKRTYRWRHVGLIALLALLALIGAMQGANGLHRSPFG